MTGNNSHPSAAAAPDAPSQQRRRSPVPLAILAAIFIVVPFLAWYGTWFGRTLSDEDISKYLLDEAKPRHVQHALSQIAERIEKEDASVKQWYPQVVALASSSVMEIRQTVAWVMGHDHQSEEFHAALRRLLEDREPIVRRNAAMALVRFKDSAGRPELRSMLHDYAVAAQSGGTINSVLPEGSVIKMGSLLARIKQGEELKELRSPLPGKISHVTAREGATVKTGEPVLSLAPDADSVENALVALAFVGEREDLKDVEHYAQGVEGMPERVKKQAALTVKAIESRAMNQP